MGIEQLMKEVFTQEVEEGQDVIPSSCALLEDSIGGVSKFEISRNDVVLSKVFGQLNSKMEEYEISDWGITETTLEEVFLKLAALAELFEDKTSKGSAKSIDEIDGALNGTMSPREEVVKAGEEKNGEEKTGEEKSDLFKAAESKAE